MKNYTYQNQEETFIIPNCVEASYKVNKPETCDETEIDFPDEIINDLKKIQEIFKCYGYKITLKESEELWSAYSQFVYFVKWRAISLSEQEFKDDMLPIAKELLQKKGYKFDA